jgi:twitching motility protein PilT
MQTMAINGSTPSRIKRRNARRIQLKFPIWFRSQDSSDALAEGMAQDISISGLVFLTDERVDVSTPLTVFFDSLPGDRKTREIDAVVTRTERDDETGQYLTGVKFTDPNEASRDYITAALQHTDLIGLLRLMEKKGASDLHLAADCPPLVRLTGHLHPLRKQALSSSDLRAILYGLLDDHRQQVFERELELDFSLPVTSTLHFRVNMHLQRGNVEATFRRIEPAVRSFAELHLPDALQHFAELRDGLVIVTGPAKSGKTTAVAAMVEHINATRTAVIITLEDPIEYIYRPKRSLIKQREIDLDTRSHAVALRQAIRQDTDVIVVGDIRDEATMQATLDAAEMGHLVVATLPAASCVQAILRACHFFTPERQPEMQLRLANCLRGMIALHLLPRVDQPAFIPATEILTCTETVANMIRHGTLEQIPSVIQTGSRFGMQALESSLEQLQQAGYIDAQRASTYLPQRSRASS